jgi:hypothetical protein
MLAVVEGVRREVSAIRTGFVEPLIGELAGRQYGVVARRQLIALGLKSTAIARRVAAGRLHRIHAGVYAVGHPVLGPNGRRMAAVLACGPGAALSHASAGALWELRPSAAVLTDVSVPRPGGQRRPRLRIHRAPDLRPDEITTKDAIPVTSPARTLLDLAAILQRRALEQALDRAEVQRLTDYPALAALARAHPGHHGAGKLTAALNTHHAATTLTKGKLEERFLTLCRDHGLPTPLVNTWPAGKEVDFLFAAQRLIVETDSWRYHKTRRAFENDRRRDAHHTRAGYRTLRFTHRQLTNEPHTVAAAVRAALGSLRSTRPGAGAPRNA